VDEKVKTQLRSLLRDPALINCSDRQLGELFSILTDVNQHDDAKMRRLIQDGCDPAVVWRELENDIAFFSETHTFEGGFVIDPLVCSTTTFETWKPKGLASLYDSLKDIRNCLVHARERRENKVILPTDGNHKLIARFDPVIARIAQQVALKS
jgi:hypothetical protein